MKLYNKPFPLLIVALVGGLISVFLGGQGSRASSIYQVDLGGIPSGATPDQNINLQTRGGYGLSWAGSLSYTQELPGGESLPEENQIDNPSMDTSNSGNAGGAYRQTASSQNQIISMQLEEDEEKISVAQKDNQAIKTGEKIEPLAINTDQLSVQSGLLLGERGDNKNHEMIEELQSSEENSNIGKKEETSSPSPIVEHDLPQIANEKMNKKIALNKGEDYTKNSEIKHPYGAKKDLPKTSSEILFQIILSILGIIILFDILFINISKWRSKKSSSPA